ncbi:aminotransferase class I/II-fold pyridoxal phosphate-dependent enzyme [Xanthomonas graminis]|uniref:aminotransferase class I/II-fold pyridoxal phosphate-dependent enzyme n=1 Tax=Xanthomonas graminis TaxID=3390026 RepID=UPI001F01EB55|nr:aminotransferase class I/II-fold pyridoxal phosphate-dependent enzyme [Xanthomonas translucens]UKE73367.1 aminotransferase class I/II-fold pyridoxal phosphate-dependent enzyme [Xanthomonas translucens pv. phleipratensis]
MLSEAWSLVTTRVHRYPDFAKLAAEFGRRLEIPVDRFVLCPGTDTAIRSIVQNACRGDVQHRLRILLHAPNYYAWEQAAAIFGMKIDLLGWADPASQAEELLARARTSSPALVALSFPNGPIGGGMTLQDVDELAEICVSRGHRLVVDVCYSKFCRELPDLYDRWSDGALVISSLSKSHALAGCRIGIVSGDPKWISELADMRIEHAVSAVSADLALAMIDRTRLLTKIWDDISTSRRFVSESLERLGFKTVLSGGNFVTFRAPSVERAHSIHSWLEGRGFRLKWLSDYAGYEDHLRVTVGELGCMHPVIDALAEVVGFSLEHHLG